MRWWLPIKDGDKIEAQGEALLKVFYESTYQDPPNVVGVEVPFTIELPDPVTGEILEERLVGALDLVVERDKKNVVGEHNPPTMTVIKLFLIGLLVTGGVHPLNDEVSNHHGCLVVPSKFSVLLYFSHPPLARPCIWQLAMRLTKWRSPRRHRRSR